MYRPIIAQICFEIHFTLIQITLLRTLFIYITFPFVLSILFKG
jgi:hypothetical protein